MSPKGRLAEQILENMSTGVLTCNTDLVITHMNPAGEVMFGVSAKQVTGRELRHLTRAEQDRILDPVQLALESDQTVTAHDVELELTNGEHATLDFTVTPIGQDPDSVLLEFTQVDRFLRLAREENRLDSHAANREVLRGIAHEIKNPLGGLRGAAQLLDRELAERDMREYTRIIIHEADRLRNLVDRMMGSYRPLQHVPVNVHEVLEHVRKLVLAEGHENLYIERDYDPSLPDVPGDREQLIQAVLNIVRNAAEAMQNNGVITLATRVERSVYLHQRRHRQVTRIDIADSGPGIPEQMLDKIFYPMVTGRPEGSGLGLSIAQDIVDRHGGLIDVSSIPGRTCFTLFLPLDNGGPHDG